ncbi:carboxypeptidase-like regulatory domain-containing protein [Edaphobacter flagellatus]|uniref:carboxypeptidase-like regulatory domain-containing protein n=1 Tax=Edaphobacter flagellatus TaxID=1933044 RepID=UPI0021B305C4|nr:carboxypeptidase-like regulatory domain-containing protein [Edaphobacter flagellatus]
MSGCFWREFVAACEEVIELGQAMRVIARLCWAFFFAWTSLSALHAQAPVDGTIRGIAMDQAAAAVAGAVVEIRDASHGLQFTTKCDARGAFLLAHLPVGQYSLTLSAPGFATLTLNNIAVEAGGTAGVSMQLKVAGVREVVTAIDDDEEGIASIDQSASAAASSVVAQADLDGLPVSGRQWQSFALLAPAANAGDVDSDHQLVSFRGLAVTQNSTSVDGVDDNDSFHSVARAAQTTENEESADGEAEVNLGGAHGSAASWRRSGAAYSFSQAAVREFRINTQNYSALYGHGAGGAIATVTKSGSNTLHGSGFYVARTSAWDASNPFSIATSYRDGVVGNTNVKPSDLRQQFGGTIGGAVIRDRLFYFYAFDQQRRGFPAISSPGDPNFYLLTPTQKVLLANRGVTPAKINSALNYLNSLTGPVNRRDDQTIHFVKLDWAASARNRASVQYNRLRSAVPAGLRGAPVVDRGIASLGNGSTRLDAVAARWLWMGSAHFTNELRVAYGHELRNEQAQTPLPQEPAIGVGGLAPEIAIGPSGLAFGTPAGVGREAYPDERRLQLSDTATWAFGHHLLLAGLDVSVIHDRVSALDNRVGTFRYDSGATSGRAGGLVDWITDYTFHVNAYSNGGCPSINAAVHLFCFRSYAQSFGEQALSWKTQDWAGFVQENWRPRANLSVNAGLRYEYELFPLPQRPNTALDAVFGNVGATSILPEDRNNFGPRIGIAWAPFGAGRGVVRVGYGVYYGRVPGATVRSALVNTALDASSTHIRFTPNTVTNCPQAANQGFGYVCTYVAAPPAAIAGTTSATVFSRRFRTPMVQQGSLSMERGVGAGVFISATYLMNIDRQLSGSVDINIAPSTTTKTFQLQGGTNLPGVRDGDTFILPVYTARINDSFGPVTAILSNVNASYNALAVEARRRSRAGLEFRAAFTWSKAIDEGQAIGATPRTNAQLDPFTIGYDKGLSRLNFPHKLVVSAVWQPKLRTSERWLAHVANGWTASGIFYETSGRPYSYEIFGGTRLTGGHESINGSGGAVYLPTVGRNTLRLPDTARLDLRIARSLRMTDRVRLRGTAEAFNLFNRVNYTGVQQRAFLTGTSAAGVTPLIFQDAATVAAEGLNVRPFGAYTEAGTATARERQLQLGLHLEF